MEQAHKPDERLAERYFLGELTDDEAEAYEAHYFDCPRCAEYVVEELAMLESGRAVALEQNRIAPVADIAAARKRKREWLPLAVAAALVIAVGTPLLLRGPAQPEYATFTIPGAQVPALRFSLDRGEAAQLHAVKADAPILQITVPNIDALRVDLVVRNAATKAVMHGPERLTDEKLSSSFLLVLSPLPAGTYEVVIEGVREDGNRSTIASEKFEVRR